MKKAILVCAIFTFAVSLGVICDRDYHDRRAHRQAIAKGVPYESDISSGDKVIVGLLVAILGVLMLILYRLWDAPTPKIKSKHDEFRSPLT